MIHEQIFALGCVGGSTHHSIKRHGDLRCADCGAFYVIDIRGARWVAPERKRRRAA